MGDAGKVCIFYCEAGFFAVETVTHSHSSHKTYVAPNGVKIVRKKRGSFVRPKSDQFKRVKEAWRKPRGIDSPTRRRFRGARLMPNRGYGNAKATRGMELNGKYNIVVNNMGDLEALKMKNKKYNLVLGHALGGKSRALLIERAGQIGFKVANIKAKVTAEEAS